MFSLQKKIVIFSGAGLDAPSGIQTFRGSGGLWNGNNIDDVCNEKTWKKNFELVHSFYNDRRVQLSHVEPNEAHKAIKRITDKYGSDNVFNITMNVSDLQERAGVECLQLHGKLKELRCEACNTHWNIGYGKFDALSDKCPNCGLVDSVRPNIVFFNGATPMRSYLNRAIEYLQHEDSIIVVMGTQGSVINISEMIKDKLCHKFLCNMHSSSDINENQFEEVYLESVETAILKIEKSIYALWKI